MRNIYLAVLACVAVLPITACAKSDVEMCQEMAKQIAKLNVLNEAPMDARTDLIEYQIKNHLQGERLQTWTRKCIEKRTPSSNMQHYECGMSATTLNELYSCDNKFPPKRGSR